MNIKTTIEKLRTAVSDFSAQAAGHSSFDLGENAQFKDYFLFEPGESKDDLIVCAFNGMQERTISVPLDSADHFEGSFLISMKRLSNICSRLPGDMEVSFVVDGDRCYIKSKKAEYDLVTTTEHEFSKMEEISKERKIEITETNIKFIFNQTAFAMAKNDPRAYLEGVLLFAEKNSLTGVATNGHRLAMCKMENVVMENIDQENKEGMQAILPRAFIEDVEKKLEYTDKIAEIFISDKGAGIKTDNFQLKTHVVDGKYPDWKKVIPEGCNWSLEINKEEFLNGIHRAMAVCDLADDPLCIKLEDKQVLFLAKNASTSEEARAIVDARSKGSCFEVGLNASYLTEAVNTVEAEDIVLEMIDSTTAVKIHGKNAKESLFLIMPIKL